MDDKEYRHIPHALFEAITFLAQALPKRSVPTCPNNRGHLLHVDMILTDHPTQYPHIFCIANLNEQIPASLLDIADQNFIAILCNPIQDEPLTG